MAVLTYELNESEVIEIIKEHFESKNIKITTEPKIVLGTRTVGHFHSEHDEMYFKCIKFQSIKT